MFFIYKSLNTILLMIVVVVIIVIPFYIGGKIEQFLGLSGVH